MSIDSPPDLERLRQAFAAVAEEAGRRSPAECPPAEHIFAAAQGELAAEELGRVLDHVAVCAACAEAWRLAVEVRRQVAPRAKQGELIAGKFGRSRITQVFGVIAALLLLAISLRFFRPGTMAPEDPVMRGADEIQILDATVDLKREHCVLRWRLEPKQEDARFEVVVMNAELESLANATAISQYELEIPPERLAKVPAGGMLLWRVEASLQDGQVVASPAFSSRLP